MAFMTPVLQKRSFVIFFKWKMQEGNLWGVGDWYLSKSSPHAFTKFQSHLASFHEFFAKRTSTNDVQQFLVFFDLPTYPRPILSYDDKGTYLIMSDFVRPTPSPTPQFFSKFFMSVQILEFKCRLRFIRTQGSNYKSCKCCNLQKVDTELVIANFYVHIYIYI